MSSLARIEVIATRSEDAANIARASYPDRVVLASYEAVLNSRDLDAIYICLPPGLHFILAKKSLEAGKSVLIEKPAVLEVWEATLLDEIARAKQLLVMEAWWYRFHPLVESVRQLIASESLGPIRHISSSFSYVNADQDDSRWKAELGGALNDMFSYHIDFLNYVMGIRNSNVDLMQAFSRPRYGVDACIAAELITDAGTVCNFMAGLDRPSLSKTFVLGENGSLEIPHLRVLPEFGEAKYIHYSRAGLKVATFPPVNAYCLMLDAFAAACLGGVDTPVSFQDTIDNTHLLSRIKIARDE